MEGACHVASLNSNNLMSKSYVWLRIMVFPIFQSTFLLLDRLCFGIYKGRTVSLWSQINSTTNIRQCKEIHQCKQDETKC